MPTKEEWRKIRRKARRVESKYRAHQALIGLLGWLRLGPTIREVGPGYMPSISDSPNASLSALLRLGRRLRPMLEQAQRELDRRYRDETLRRRRELKKLYKEKVLKELGR